MKKIINILLFSLLIYIFSGCKKALTEQLNSFVSPDNFYQNEQEDQAGVNSVYYVLYSFFSNLGFITATDGTSDLMRGTATANLDEKFSYSPGAPGFGANIWSAGYQGVLFANNNIYGIEGSPVADSIKMPIAAEARFLRDLYYFFLTNTFNDVPFWTFPLNTEDKVQQVSVMGKTDATIIRDSLISDLTLCASLLPLQQTGSNLGRATKGAALALKEKIALFNKDWTTAIAAGQEIVTEGQYQLLPDYASVFSSKNTPESIFEIQYVYSVNGLQQPNSLPAYFMPANHTTNSTIYDGVNLGTSKATSYGDVLPTRLFMGLYSDSDKRKNIMLGITYNGQTFNRYKNSGLAWMGPKFWDLNMNNIASGKDVVYLRYADVLLMLAEAYNENNDQQNALTYLNEIRARAGISPYQNTSQDSIRQTIRDERARELGGEFQRRWDLVRWGIFSNAIQQTAEDDSVRASVQQYQQFFPIPALEITKNPNLKQNPGY